mmetsp:Transcript_144265/g.447932  ORF Transcript_144265/g.447932 Transcript_144265/m.447932 type:complete len:350 (-) Transcript_144265:84-1133(-)
MGLVAITCFSCLRLQGHASTTACSLNSRMRIAVLGRRLAAHVCKGQLFHHLRRYARDPSRHRAQQAAGRRVGHAHRRDDKDAALGAERGDGVLRKVERLVADLGQVEQAQGDVQDARLPHVEAEELRQPPVHREALQGDEDDEREEGHVVQHPKQPKQAQQSQLRLVQERQVRQQRSHYEGECHPLVHRARKGEEVDEDRGDAGGGTGVLVRRRQERLGLRPLALGLHPPALLAPRLHLPLPVLRDEALEGIHEAAEAELRPTEEAVPVLVVRLQDAAGQALIHWLLSGRLEALAELPHVHSARAIHVEGVERRHLLLPARLEELGLQGHGLGAQPRSLALEGGCVLRG